MAHKIGPAMPVVEVFFQLTWLCVCENSFTEDALRLLQIPRFSDASETETIVVIIPFPFLRHDGAG